MPGKLRNRAIAQGLGRFQAMRRVPVMKLLVLAEVVLLARDHLVKLEPEERRRLVELVRLGRGRRRNLTLREREELSALVAKAEPRLFLGVVAEKFSPLPLPRRVVRGRARR